MEVTQTLMASRRRQDRIGALQDAERYVNSAHTDLIRIGHLLRAEMVSGGGLSALEESLATARRKLDIAEARIREVRDGQASS